MEDVNLAQLIDQLAFFRYDREYNRAQAAASSLIGALVSKSMHSPVLEGLRASRIVLTTVNQIRRILEVNLLFEHEGGRGTRSSPSKQLTIRLKLVASANHSTLLN